jgi:F0F1-type ATP synthase alpha subunit
LNGEEQVVLIYAGVRGFLDKMVTGDISKFETQFLEYMKTNHKALLEEIRM